MLARLVDHHRTYRSEPIEATSLLSSSVLGALLEGQKNTNGSLELECDQAFFDALTVEAMSDPDHKIVTVDRPWRDGHKAMFRGIPVVVVDF